MAAQIKPYADNRRKGEQVQEMFDAIAPSYDFMNTAMTMGLHRRWRDQALDAVIEDFGGAKPGDVLDIATGTGDVAFELHKRLPAARITGLDLSEGMLAIAREKLSRSDAATRRLMDFEQGDSLAISYPDASFDLVTVAYGVRNFDRLGEGLKEMARVLRSGGRICIIELSEPEGAVLKGLYRLYTRTLIPAAGRLVSGDSRAYTYLPQSIAASPQRRAMTELMQEAGFKNCRWKSLTLGAVTYYIGNS